MTALVVALGCISVSAVIVAFGLFGSLVLVFLVGAFFLLILGVRSSNRRQRKLLQQGFQNAVAAVNAYKPRFLVHWDGSSESVYQLEAWLPYLEKLDLPFLVILRNPESFERVLQVVNGDPIVVAQTPLEMEQFLVPSATTVFYANNADCNNQILRFEGFKHVQLGHGDSDKSSSATRTFRLFDRVYVSGQAGIDRFNASGIELDESTIVSVGRPQVSGITQAKQPIGSIAAPTLLYAPTWWGDFADTSHSSLPFAEGLIDLLLNREVTLIFRPHPFTLRHAETATAAARIRERLRSHSEKTGTPHIFGEKAERKLSLTECFNQSDVMIADVSAVVTDYLYSGKPLGLFVPTATAGNAHLDDGQYLFTEHAEAWSTQLDKLLITDPLREQREEVRKYRLANATTTPPDGLFVDAARNDVLFR